MFFFARIKEASLKYFGRSLAECEDGFERLEDSTANFSDIGSDIGEVGKQLAQLKVERKPQYSRRTLLVIQSVHSCSLVYGFGIQVPYDFLISKTF